MFKKGIALVSLITFCLLAGMPAFAQEQAGAEVQQEMKEVEQGPIRLSLEEAIQMALTNNPEIALSETKIAKAKVGLREAKSVADGADEALDMPAFIPGMPDTLSLLQGKYVLPRIEEANVLLAGLGADFTKKGLQMKVEKAYYDVLKAEGELANKKAAFQRAKEQHRLAEASVLAGIAAKSDAMATQVGVTKAEVELASAQNSLDGAMMSLAQVLGKDLTERYLLTTEFTYVPAEDLDITVYVAELMETDLSVVGAREGLAIAELQLEQVAKVYTSNVYAYQKAKYDRDEAQLKYDRAKTRLALDARQSYLNLKTAEKAYGLLEESVKFAQETARLAALRYEAGVGTRLEMEKAYDQLNETEAQRLGMLYNYNLAKTQLQYGIFMGSLSDAAMGGDDA